jgi:peptidyl-prolyl cis-trans isomerase D
MLDNLRRFGRTWIGKVLGAFLLVGLAGFGISNVLLDFGSQNVATVGGEPVTVREFARAYNTDLRNFAQQIGQMPTPEQAQQFGIQANTLSRLISEGALNQMGARMGVGVSEARLGQMLRADPTFSGVLGQFDRQSFTQVLRQVGFTEAEYFDLQTKAARRQQLSAALFADTAIPVAAQELFNRYSGDRRTLDYFVVNAQALPPVAEPTEEELAAYLTEHQTEFRTAETRTADLLVLNTETLADTIEISDADVAAEYERTKAQRVRVERRTIRQVPLPTPELEAAFEAGQAAGTSFDDLVAQHSLSVTELGTLSKAEVTDPNLAEAAFAIPEVGGFTLISGIGGQRAVSVSAIEAGAEISLEESRDEIRAQLARTEARSSYVDVLDQIEELRAAFQPISQIAERFKLPLEKVTITAGGTELASAASLPEDDRTRVATAIFAAEQGDLAPTVAISANNNIWFDLEAVEPARDQTLDEVRDQVAAAIVGERETAAVSAEVENIIARLDAGEAFADVALSLNQFPNLSQPITRSGDGTPTINQAVGSAAFAGGPGHFGSAVNGDGDHVVFQVVEITPPADTSLEAARTYVQESTQQSLYADFIAGLRGDISWSINQAALDQALLLGASGQ